MRTEKVESALELLDKGESELGVGFLGVVDSSVGQLPIVFPGTRMGGFYRVLNPALYFVRPSAAISALQVGEWLKFGNSVLQLINVSLWRSGMACGHRPQVPADTAA